MTLESPEQTDLSPDQLRRVLDAFTGGHKRTASESEESEERGGAND